MLWRKGGRSTFRQTLSPDYRDWAQRALASNHVCCLKRLSMPNTSNLSLHALGRCVSSTCRDLEWPLLPSFSFLPADTRPDHSSLPHKLDCFCCWYHGPNCVSQPPLAPPRCPMHRGLTLMKSSTLTSWTSLEPCLHSAETVREEQKRRPSVMPRAGAQMPPFLGRHTSLDVSSKPDQQFQNITTSCRYLQSRKHEELSGVVLESLHGK